MNTYWGVVSTRPANAQLTTIDGQPTLFAFVVQQAGTPQFWGRYIAGKAQGDLLTADEATFLLTNNCHILLVHYGISPGGDYQAGVQDAMNANPRNLNPDGSLRFYPPLFVSPPRPGCDFDLSSYGLVLLR